MSKQPTVDTLRSIAFLQGIADKHLEKLAAISQEVELGQQQTIFHQHEPARDVYLIVSGKVSLAVCEPKVGCRQIMEVRDGELIGWSPVLGRSRLSDTASTATAARLVKFPGDELVKLCDENPEFGYQFMRRTAEVLAERLGATRLQLLHMSGVQLPEAPIYTD
jgi:CRP-like cAMP-binding protein